MTSASWNHFLCSVVENWPAQMTSQVLRGLMNKIPRMMSFPSSSLLYVTLPVPTGDKTAGWGGGPNSHTQSQARLCWPCQRFMRPLIWIFDIADGSAMSYLAMLYCLHIVGFDQLFTRCMNEGCETSCVVCFAVKYWDRLCSSVS